MWTTLMAFKWVCLVCVACEGVEGGFPMIWTKWLMAKHVVNEWVLISCYEVCGLMSRDKWRCYDLLNMICLF